MARAWLIALLMAVAAALVAPLSAQARTPCPAEQAPPTAANGVQISDAIFCLTNQVRVHHGLPAVRRDPRLDAAAMLHSRDMGIRNFFGHVNPDGLNPGARATAQGYTQGVGENIAYGYANARAVVLGWMASAGHCRNILSGAVDLGVGTVVTGKPYYTQVLGDYFTRPVDEAPRGGCPYSLNLDTIGPAAPALLTEPPAAPPSSTPTPAATATATPTATVTRTTPKPALRALALAPSRFRAGRRGTTISYTLSAPATVTFRIQRARRSGTGRAVRYQTMTKRFTRDGATGANTLRFTGRLGGARLRPGRYRLQAVATDAAVTSAPLVRARFQITR